MILGNILVRMFDKMPQEKQHQHLSNGELVLLSKIFPNEDFKRKALYMYSKQKPMSNILNFSIKQFVLSS